MIFWRRTEHGWDPEERESESDPASMFASKPVLAIAAPWVACPVCGRPSEPDRSECSICRGWVRNADETDTGDE